VACSYRTKEQNKIESKSYQTGWDRGLYSYLVRVSVSVSVCECMCVRIEESYSYDWFVGSVGKFVEAVVLCVFLCVFSSMSSKSSNNVACGRHGCLLGLFRLYVFCFLLLLLLFYMTRVRRISFCVLILGFLGVAVSFVDCCIAVVIDVVVVLDSLSNTAGKLLVFSPM